MAKGLSPLQLNILTVLADWPDAEEPGDNLNTWARPRDIMHRLGRKPTPANRVTISKALRRLKVRDLVAVHKPSSEEERERDRDRERVALRMVRDGATVSEATAFWLGHRPPSAFRRNRAGAEELSMARYFSALADALRHA